MARDTAERSASISEEAADSPTSDHGDKRRFAPASGAVSPAVNDVPVVADRADGEPVRDDGVREPEDATVYQPRPDGVGVRRGDGLEADELEATHRDAAIDEAPPRKPNRMAVLMGAAGVAALALGFGIGRLSEDPTASDEYRDLKAQHEELDRHYGDVLDDNDDLSSANERLTQENSRLNDQVREFTGRAGELETRQAELDARAEEVAAAEQAVSEREAAVAGAEAQQAANTFGSGTWTVGVDVAPGTYRVTEAVNDMCYWGITVTGSNGGNIIENDIVTGGFPQVTISEGQTFESSRCGSWTKQ